MGTIVYLSIRLACACYILYKVCGQKKKIREICDLLYAKLPPVKKKEPENVLSEPIHLVRRCECRNEDIR